MQHSTACVGHDEAASCCSALHCTAYDYSECIQELVLAGGRGAGQDRAASSVHCVRRQASPGAHAADRQEENTLDAFAMQEAIGADVKTALLVSRGGVQCVICMCYVLYDSVASKGTARKQRVVERCDGRKEAYPGAVETPRLAPILRRLSVIGWRYHDQ